MVKLGDLISVSFSNIVIMDGFYEIINFDPCRVDKLKIINPDILECEVKRFDVINNKIRVWLKEEEKKND